MTTFRCTAGEPASPFCEAVSDTTDRIRDDGSAYGYSPIVAKIWSSGFYSFHFEPPSGRAPESGFGRSDWDRSVPGVELNPEHSSVVNSHPLTLDTASIELKPLTQLGPSFPDCCGA